MAENKIYPWAQSSDANVFSDADYAADVEAGGIYVGGVQTGLASSKQANKTWRQATAPGSGLGQFLVDNLSVDVTDADTPTTFSTRIANAILKLAQISPFNQSWAVATGGYRKYAIVSDSSGNYWSSTADQNVTVPGAGGAKWQSLFNGYATEAWADGQFATIPNLQAETSARSTADATLQTNITNEATTRANADAGLQSQINNKISTTLVDDGVNSAVTIMSLLDVDNTIWVGTAKSGTMALVKSQPASGFYKILNLTTDTNGNLIVPDSSGRTLTYAHGISGKIAASGNCLGGYWVRNGNVLRQVFTYTANYGDFIHFPTEYEEAPVVHVTAAAYGGMATTANILGSPVYNGFTFISSVYAGDPNRLENTGTNTISVMVEGLVNS